MSGEHKDTVEFMSLTDDEDSHKAPPRQQRRASLRDSVRVSVAKAKKIMADVASGLKFRQGISLKRAKQHMFKQPAENFEEVAAVYESLDYEANMSASFLKHRYRVQRRRVYGYSGATLVRWLFAILIGIIMGFVAYMIVTMIEIAGVFKQYAVRSAIDSSGDVYMALPSFLAVTISYTLLAVVPVLWFAPEAAGGGIAETMAYLNGIHLNQFLRLRTILVKIWSVVFAVGSGLVVGPEAPLVHVGMGIASGFTRGRKEKGIEEIADTTNISNAKGKSEMPVQKYELGTRRLGKVARWFHIFHNDKDRRDFLSCGAAAGLATAFGAPIGGVLFSLEEASSFWSNKLTWRCLVCTMIGCFTLSFFRPPFGYLSAPGLLSFGDLSQTYHYVWELGIFAAMGVGGGLLGALFNQLFGALSLVVPKKKWKKLVYALAVSLACNLTAFFLPLVLHQCKPLLKGSDTSVYGLRYQCKMGEMNDLASLLFLDRESSIHQIFQDASTFSLSSLAVAAAFYFVFMLFSSTLAVPAGLFLPTIFCGASLGAMVGNAMSSTEYQVGASAYAIVGATALLGGIQRTTISLVVIIIEGTDNVHNLLPIVLTAAVSKWVADRFNPSLYEIIMELKSLPFLPAEPTQRLMLFRASEVMAKDVVTLSDVDTVDRVLEVLAGPHHGFPVVDGNGKLVGTILRKHLLLLLHEGEYYRESDLPDNMDEYSERVDDIIARMLEVHGMRRIEAITVDIPKEHSKYYVPVRQFANRGPLFVAADTPLMRAYRLFRTMGMRHLCVVDEEHHPVGMITRKDLVEFLEKSTAPSRPLSMMSVPSPMTPARAFLVRDEKGKGEGLPPRWEKAATMTAGRGGGGYGTFAAVDGGEEEEVTRGRKVTV